MHPSLSRGIVANLRHDGPASLVVFLVAVPLCLGIALASGAPLFSGIIAGIVGGIVVGLTSRSAVGVSGPAAGLAVIVLTAIELANQEGLDAVFRDAGFDWRNAGCSMCLGMNPDTLSVGERSASTSNRNFEGRQGRGGRTHLVSPEVAAATAVVGRLAAPADLPVLSTSGV